MRRVFCVLLTAVLLLSVCAALADGIPKEIEIIPYEDLPDPNPGQHHYLLLCIDQWSSRPRPKDAPTPKQSNGNHKDLYGNTDGMVILTLDTRAHRIMLTSIIRDAIIRKPGSLDEKSRFGRINYVYNDYGPEVLCQVISQHLGIKIEKYILFNFSQIQDIIDLPGLDGVDIELNSEEVRYLARYAVPVNSVVKADGYFASRNDPYQIHFVSTAQEVADFTIPASLLEDTKQDVTVTSDYGQATLTLQSNGKYLFTSGSGGKDEKGSWSCTGGLLRVWRGPDLHQNLRAPEGLYHFRGHSAVLYMRIRKADSQGDFKRTQRVRTVLSALADKCRSFTLEEANNLANSIMDHNDATNLTLEEVLNAASYAFELRNCTVEELRIPADEDKQALEFAGMACQEIDWVASREKLAYFLEHTKLVRDEAYMVTDDDE